MLLKHTAFQPQVAAALTVNSGIGMLTEVHDILDGKIGVGDELSYRLANAVNVDISHGRVAEVAGAWNESKFSYILLVDVYLNNEKIREEIYQGYTDRVDTLERSLINVATTTVDPTTMCFINKQMHISFTTNEMGRVIPKFHQPSSVLTDTSYSQSNGDLPNSKAIVGKDVFKIVPSKACIKIAIAPSHGKYFNILSSILFVEFIAFFKQILFLF